MRKHFNYTAPDGSTLTGALQTWCIKLIEIFKDEHLKTKDREWDSNKVLKDAISLEKDINKLADGLDSRNDVGYLPMKEMMQDIALNYNVVKDARGIIRELRRIKDFCVFRNQVVTSVLSDALKDFSNNPTDLDKVFKHFNTTVFREMEREGDFLGGFSLHLNRIETDSLKVIIPTIERNEYELRQDPISVHQKPYDRKYVIEIIESIKDISSYNEDKAQSLTKLFREASAVVEKTTNKTQREFLELVLRSLELCYRDFDSALFNINRTMKSILIIIEMSVRRWHK